LDRVLKKLSQSVVVTFTTCPILLLSKMKTPVVAIVLLVYVGLLGGKWEKEVKVTNLVENKEKIVLSTREEYG